MTSDGVSFCASATELEEDAGARRGGSGRKLHEDAGRAETRVKISDMSRCWTAVSYANVKHGTFFEM